MALHDGAFSIDDVFTCALIKKLAKTCNKNLVIFRSQDLTTLNNVDIRVGVGGRLDPKSFDFDYHQTDYEFGKNIAKSTSLDLVAKWCLEENFYTVFSGLYINGLEYQANTRKPSLKYPSIMGFDTQLFVPVYGEETSADTLFSEAVDTALFILNRMIATTLGYLKSEEELAQCTRETLADGKIIVLNKKLRILSFLHPDLCWVIFEEAPDTYSFLGRNGYALKSQWRGLTADAILTQTGFPGTFFHKSGFMGKMKTLEGAKNICLLSL